jgi:UDP-N-acetylmuramoyl-tripeptide--D-alanyl-D-alanine ligase
VKLSLADLRTVPQRGAFDLSAERWTATGVSTDSRSVGTGDLFVAIRGERFDGHDFVSAAVERGASGIVVDARWAEANGPMMTRLHVPRVVVEDTVQTLGALARLVRRRFDIPVIAVGGSNGKTTTKEMLKAVLSRRMKVLATEGNLNNHIGVPQTLFRFEPKHEAAVIEVGTNHPGEIAYLCSVAEPTHGLLTNIGHEHMEFFGSLDSVADAEAELWQWLVEHDGTAFVNGDDARIVRRSKPVKKKVMFGFKSRAATVKGSRLKADSDGRAVFSLRRGSRKPFEVRVAIPGLHNGMNALAAATVGLTLGVPSSDVIGALGTVPAANKRMQVVRANGVVVLNDTYNANPDSMLAALATLRTFSVSGRRIAVLGDMFELGATAEAGHRVVGKAVRKEKVDLLFTTGTLAAEIGRASGLSTAEHFADKRALIRRLQDIMRPGDVILVKGSRGMQMEEVVAAIVAQG